MANEASGGRPGTAVAPEDREVLEDFAQANGEVLRVVGWNAAKLIDAFKKSNARTARDFLNGVAGKPTDYARAADDEIELTRMLEQSESGMKQMGVDPADLLRRFRASGKGLKEFLGKAPE